MPHLKSFMNPHAGAQDRSGAPLDRVHVPPVRDLILHFP
jgi:hypothetical protein